MKKIKNNFLVKFVVALFLIGILIGFAFYFVYKPDLMSPIEDFKGLITSTRQNVFLLNIGIISLIFVLSISLIGLPILLFYIFYEGASIGFTCGLFLNIFHIKGLIFYIIFIIIAKLLFILIMIYFSILSIRYSLNFLDSIISKNRENLYKTIVYHFYRYLVVLFLVFINCLLVFLLSNKIISVFIGLIN